MADKPTENPDASPAEAGRPRRLSLWDVAKRYRMLMTCVVPTVTLAVTVLGYWKPWLLAKGLEYRPLDKVSLLSDAVADDSRLSVSFDGRPISNLYKVRARIRNSGSSPGTVPLSC